VIEDCQKPEAKSQQHFRIQIFPTFEQKAMKKIIVSVTNDLTSDQRVHRVCLTLTGMGFKVQLIGRRLPSSLPLSQRIYLTKRMRLLFLKGPMFYAEFNFRLMLFLLFQKSDLLLSNDLDTLPANFLVSRLKRKKLIYDSHEYFTEVPELVGRPRVQKIWKWFEKKMVPGVDAAYTVCRSLADVYSEKYRIPFWVVRNLPFSADYHAERSQPDEKKKTIIYQGALNKGRGLEQAIRAMQYLPEASLEIAGSGDIDNELHNLAARLKINNVFFTGKLPFEKVMDLTLNADLGISVEEDLGLNYHFALPNKLFDYIQARIPVAVSDLPEMSQIVREYDIGLIAASSEPEMLAATFRKALYDETLRKKWEVNLDKAAQVLNWEKEQQIVRGIFGKFL
jgi:glycosyltransferase involved in cell wall biosynthesis